MGVETLQADNTGTQTADTLSFFVHDEVGSVVAAVTENLGGSNQQLVVYSHDVWGKARPASGSNAYADPLPATYLPGTSTLAGQQEGFAGHEDLEDIGIVDMEGRIYDPEVGRFLSPDPNVQYPDSTQGYNRYTYVNNNPLSLSDPTGYFSFSAALSAGDPTAGFDPQDYGKAVGFAGPIVGAALNAVPGCQGWCDLVVTAASQAESGYLETGNVGDGIQQGVIAGVEAFAFSEAGGAFGSSPSPGQLFERSVIEGVIGGVGAAADGGDFGSGFAGAFVASEAGPLVSRMGPGPSQVIVTALVGGTATRLAGGNFAEGAFAAALQNLFNEQGWHGSQSNAAAADPYGQYSVEELKEIISGASDSSVFYNNLTDREFVAYFPSLASEDNVTPDQIGDARNIIQSSLGEIRIEATSAIMERSIIAGYDKAAEEVLTLGVHEVSAPAGMFVDGFKFGVEQMVKIASPPRAMGIACDPSFGCEPVPLN